MIRPALIAVLRRWHEVMLCIGAAILGLWLMRLGGYVLLPIGAMIVAMAGALGLMAHRRARFSGRTGAIGMVEVDEAQIGYFGPTDGGFVSLQDLTELRLLRLNGQQIWRLKQADGQALLIPVDAAGAERLFDAFASLPNMNTAALVASLAQHGDRPLDQIGQTIWRRAG